ncbi:hypothetical protein BANRA_05532 [Klebsiella pneumoniae]|nr:hypothetical protein BANRA_05532 [Klebsiella pneumoniae]
MQNQPQRKGGGDDGLMIIGALLIMITVMWFGFRDYVIYGVCRLLYWIYGVLPDAITPVMRPSAGTCCCRRRGITTVFRCGTLSA